MSEKFKFLTIPEAVKKAEKQPSAIQFINAWINKNKPEDEALLLVSESLYNAYNDLMTENVRFIKAQPAPPDLERLVFRGFRVVPVGLTGGEPWQVYGAYVKVAGE